MKRQYLIRETLIDRFIDALFDAIAAGKMHAIRQRLGGDAEFERAMAEGEASRKRLEVYLKEKRKDPSFAKLEKDIADGKVKFEW